MRIINAVGPATSSVSPSFPTTRVDRSPLFPTLLAPRPIRFPVNKHFPFGSLFFSLSPRETTAAIESPRRIVSLFHFSLVRSLLFSPSLSLSHQFLFFLLFFAPLFTLYQCSTRLLGIPDGVPAHATGSPATLDFVLWNPNTLVWSAFLGPVHGATVGNPWTKAFPAASSRYGTGYVKHCSSTSSRGTERRGSCDGNNND